MDCRCGEIDGYVMAIGIDRQQCIYSTYSDENVVVHTPDIIYLPVKSLSSRLHKLHPLLDTSNKTR